MEFYFKNEINFTNLEKKREVKLQKSYNLLSKIRKEAKMLSDQDIFNRYVAKKAEFNKAASITLIGHSLFDMWGDIEPELILQNQSVANLGISGVSARQYLDVVARPQHITHLGETVFLFLGVNDIVKEADYTPAKVVEWISQIVAEIQPLAKPKTRFFLLEATPVNHISTVTNEEIQVLNAYLQAHCPAPLQFVPTYEAFLDSAGDLQTELCVDGLHFNAKGYALLRQILERYL